ncbi:MAG TPA: DCC1-like thiol-disulfide oxidoreductase family protein [Polyangiaceae bacterium]|nr:DCC1-like thiol-disulfide oxidoreductase family protein [Polyangiaceae bacterium]
MKELTVLYDATCPLCVRCKGWMERQPSYIDLAFRSCQSQIANETWRELRPWLGEELVVVSDEGDAWVGPAAFLMCLWALRDWREWSYRLSGDAFSPLAERFFHALSSRRRWLASFLFPEPACADGSCAIDRRHHRGAHGKPNVRHSPYR